MMMTKTCPFILFVLFNLLLSILQISCENNVASSITCYVQYEAEETRISQTDIVLGYQYHKSHTTPYQTLEGEFCSKVNCACFSYRSACSYPPLGKNYPSPCTDADRQSGTIKWHHGWTSQAQCDAMRRQSHIYLDLTCCYTTQCNNQSEKIIKMVNPPAPIPIDEYNGQKTPAHLPDSYKPPQSYESYDHQSPQSLPVAQNPSQHYDSNSHPTPPSTYDFYRPVQQYNPYDRQTPQSSSTSRKPSVRSTIRIRHTTTSTVPDTYKPSEVYDKSLSSTATFLSNSFSNWIILFFLFFSLLIMI